MARGATMRDALGVTDSPRGRRAPPTQQSPGGQQVPSGGWDEADTVTSFDEPTRSRPPMLASTSSKDEIEKVVRASVDEAIIPLVQRIRDLEVRLAKAEEAARERPAEVPSTLPTAKQTRAASIPAPPRLPDLARLAHDVAPFDALDVLAYDGGRRKKYLAKVVVGILFAGVLIAIVASVASQS